jgi:hypothetical protein
MIRRGEDEPRSQRESPFKTDIDLLTNDKVVVTIANGVDDDGDDVLMTRWRTVPSLRNRLAALARNVLLAIFTIACWFIGVYIVMWIFVSLGTRHWAR